MPDIRLTPQPTKTVLVRSLDHGGQVVRVNESDYKEKPGVYSLHDPNKNPVVKPLSKVAPKRDVDDDE